MKSSQITGLLVSISLNNRRYYFRLVLRMLSSLFACVAVHGHGLCKLPFLLENINCFLNKFSDVNDLFHDFDIDIIVTNPSFKQAKKICKSGLEVRSISISCLGDPSMGK